MPSYNALESAARTIIAEETDGANTALRVGNLFLQIVQQMESLANMLGLCQYAVTVQTENIRKAMETAEAALATVQQARDTVKAILATQVNQNPQPMIETGDFLRITQPTTPGGTARLAISEAMRYLNFAEAWENAGGKLTYTNPGNPDLYTPSLNGLPIQRADMWKILAVAHLSTTRGGGSWEGRFANLGYPTYFPIGCNVGGSLGSADYLFACNAGESQTQVIAFAGDSYDYMNFSSWRYAFAGNANLREVRGLRLNPKRDYTAAELEGMFAGCSSLQILQLSGLSGGLDLSACPSISLNSLSFIAGNANGTGIPVKLYPTVYDCLCGLLTTPPAGMTEADLAAWKKEGEEIRAVFNVYK